MFEKRVVHVDHNLGVESYLLQGISQIFPPHYHDYYVIGLLEQGYWQLTHRSQSLLLSPGDFFLLNPNVSHRCSVATHETLCYRAMNIPPSTMRKFTLHITGHTDLPLFSAPVVKISPLVHFFQELHQLFMAPKNCNTLDRQALLAAFLKALLHENAYFTNLPMHHMPKVEQACKYLEENYAKNIKIHEVCAAINVKPTTLFNSFTKDLCISPRRYLIAKRVDIAKKLLLKREFKNVATKAGFFDHSHLSHSFKSVTGITPDQYKQSILSSILEE